MEKPAYWAINRISIDGEVKKRLMLVLKTFPCRRIKEKKRCFICGFDYHSRGVKSYNIVSQFRYLKETVCKNKIEHIDVLGSGSILDEEQVHYSQVLEFMEEVKKIRSIGSILIEGRAEHCYFDKLQKIKRILNNVSLGWGIGLECYSDYVRNKILKKDLRLKDYINCIKNLTELGVGVCTYILAGIPGLSLKNSLRQTRDSILAIADLYQKYHCKGRIALYPVFIAPNSQLERLYNYRKYKLISLYDIVKILLQLKDKIDIKRIPIFIGLDDEEISKNRYVGFGDGNLSVLIEKFNFTQDFSLFKGMALNET